MPNPKVLGDYSEFDTLKRADQFKSQRLSTLVELGEDNDNLDGDG